MGGHDVEHLVSIMQSITFLAEQAGVDPLALLAEAPPNHGRRRVVVPALHIVRRELRFGHLVRAGDALLPTAGPCGLESRFGRTNLFNVQERTFMR